MINKRFINKHFNFDMDEKTITNKLKGLKNKFDNKIIIKAERKIVNHKVYYGFSIFRRRINYFYYQTKDTIIKIVCNNQDMKIESPYYRTDVYYDLKFLNESNFSFYDKKSERVFNIFIRNNKEDADELKKFYNKLQKIDDIKKNIKKKKEREKKNTIKNQEMPLFKKVPVSARNEVLKKLPVYLFEENKKCFCTSCKKESALIKLDKHLSIRKCPKCNREAKVQRISMCKNAFYDFEWLMIPNKVGDKTILSYVYAYQQIFKEDYKNIVRTAYERGREVISNYKIHSYIRYEYRWELLTSLNGTFYKETCGLFNNYYNKQFCGFAYIYSKSIDFIKQYQGFKYFNKYLSLYTLEENNKDFFRSLFINLDILKIGEVFEKLEKVGLESIIEFFTSLDTMYNYACKFDYKKSSVIDILKLNKAEYKYLLEFPKEEQYNEWINLKQIKDVPFDKYKYELIRDNFGADKYKNLYQNMKLVNYLLKQNAKTDKRSLYYEYLHYVENLKKLEYKLTKLYLYPRDFYKADKRVSDEIIYMEQKEEDIKYPERRKQIKLISDALRRMPDLDKYLQGDRGLKVCVPETPEELRIAGKDLGNCIGSYVGKIAEGNTFIFFIRKISDPDTNYYAMEYKNGEIIQVRGYSNKGADDNIMEFCKAFQNYLIEQKFNPKTFLQAAA